MEDGISFEFKVTRRVWEKREQAGLGHFHKTTSRDIYSQKVDGFSTCQHTLQSFL